MAFMSLLCMRRRRTMILWNDKVFNTVELFFDGLIDKKEAIERLRYEKPNLQICFRTEKALEFLHFEGSEMV